MKFLIQRPTLSERSTQRVQNQKRYLYRGTSMRQFSSDPGRSPDSHLWLLNNENAAPWGSAMIAQVPTPSILRGGMYTLAPICFAFSVEASTSATWKYTIQLAGAPGCKYCEGGIPPMCF